MVSKWKLRYMPVFVLAVILAGCPGKKRVEDAGLPFSEEIVHGRLDNGFQYYIRQNDFPSDKIELRLNVRSGSLDETDEERGLAHFVEHMAFNGTRNYSGNEIIKFMEQAGLTFGQHSNAYTSSANTNYQLSIPVDNPELLEESLNILRDWADGVTFEPEEIAREKGVIIEEWRTRNTPANRIRIKGRDILLAGSVYPDRDPIGLVEVISGASRELLKGYYDKWYTAENMSLIVVGDIDAVALEKQIRRHFSTMEARTVPAKADTGVPLQKGLRVEVITDPEITYTSAGLTYFYAEKGPVETYGELKRLVLESGAMSMLTNRVANHINEKKTELLSFRGARPQSVYPNFTMAMFNITTTPDTLDGDIRLMLEEIERVQRFGFTREELDRFITSQRTQLERAASPDYNYESEDYADMIAYYDTYGGHLTDFAQDRDLINRVFGETDLLDYNRAFNGLLNTESVLLLVTVPERERGKVDMNAEKFRRLQAQVDAMTLTAEEETIPIASLVAEAPAGGQVVSVADYTALEGELVTYENGVRLFIKTNRAERNRFYLSAQKPGGRSVLNDMDYLYISLVGEVLSASGFEGISRRQLQQYLAARQVIVSPSSTDYTFNFEAAGSSEDLETMFELVYKYFTAADIDENAYDSLMRAQAVALVNNEQDQKTSFFRQAVEMMYKNYRRTYLLSDDLQALTPGRLMDIYRSNYLDINHFVFVISGDVDRDKVEELGRIYLASLPEVPGKIPGARNREVKLKESGVIDGYGDVEYKATNQIYFDNDVVAIAEGRYLGILTQRVLTQRLRESIREELGGAYSVGVLVSYSDYPAPEFSGRIAFTCDPDRKEELLTEIRAVVDEFTKNGITAEELRVAKTQHSVQMDSSGQQNRYWASHIASGILRGEPLLSVQENKDLVNRLTVEQVNTFIRQTMTGMRYYVATYNPPYGEPD